MPRLTCLVLCTSLLAACDGRSGVEEGEWWVGGDTTNLLLLGTQAFGMPAENLSPESEMAFFSGNGFFNQAWVEAPASTTARDGLGPLFNARSCSGCHFRDGKGVPPQDGQSPFVGVLLRISVPGPSGPEPHPIYGGQLQDQAIPGVPVEARPMVTWSEGDRGMRAPTYEVVDAAHGALGEGVMLSPRVAPHMIGLGLLEAIPEARLRELEDPEDLDGDGVSGRIQELPGPEGAVIGRFGWKGDAPTVAEQVAGAFAGDMGLTSRLVPADDCTVEQEACLAEAPGGEPEVEDRILDAVITYASALAPPVRRAADDRVVLDGKRAFHEVGCAACHTPSHVTGEGTLPAFDHQLIWPYTDLLLHDMGPGLADDRPVAGASGREWKTPPLWGLGLVEVVVGEASFLHDGRARTLREAILWHDGEASASREAYESLDRDTQRALITFLEDL